MENGCFSADSEFKLKGSIPTSLSNCGGKDLKTERNTVISFLLLLDLLLAWRRNKRTKQKEITSEKRMEPKHVDVWKGSNALEAEI